MEVGIAVIAGEHRIGQGEVRIQLHRLQVHLPSDSSILYARPSPAVLLSSQVEVVRLDIIGGRFIYLLAFLRSKGGPESRSYTPSDVGLDRKDILCCQVFIVGFRPEVLVRLGIDKLSVNAYHVPQPLNASLQDRPNAKLLSDLLEISPPFLVLHYRSTRDRLQVTDLLQVGDDVIVNPVGERYVLLRTANVVERQDGNRLPRI